MKQLVLLRHGESIWNKENRFTGWKDIGLTTKGIEEAKNAGKLMKQEGFEFDLAFTSVLKRAVKTLWLALEEMDLMWIPVQRNWRLNERHYGALQGLNKAETAAKYGDEQVLVWRRSYDTRPPQLDPKDDRHPGNDKKYKDLDPADLPTTECLKDTVNRFIPYWDQTIAPAIQNDLRVLIVAHGNSIRALIKHLEGISEEAITKVNIPTGVPFVYELKDNLSPIRNYYLGDQEAVKKAIQGVADQGKSN